MRNYAGAALIALAILYLTAGADAAVNCHGFKHKRVVDVSNTQELAVSASPLLQPLPPPPLLPCSK
jgi:hypothetical protein